MQFFSKLQTFLSKKSLSYTVRSTPEISEMLYGAKNYFTLNDISLYVNRGIAKRAEKVGQINFKLFKNGEEVLEHEILNLLDKPNDHQSGDTFWALASEYRDIAGFCVIKMSDKKDGEVFRAGNIKSLELLNSYRTQINYDGNRIKSFTETKLDGQQEEIPYENCIYWIKPDPKKPTEGISLLRAGIYSIDTDNQLSQYQNAIVKNGGTTDTVFTFKNNLTSEQLKNLKESHIKERRDPKNSDIPYFMGGEADIKRLGMTPAELAYLESKKLYTRDMTVITGVPAVLLGLSSEETYSNAETAYKIFLRETIKPICDNLVNLLDWFLVPAEYDLSYEDPSPEDVDNKIKQVNALYAVDASTINERREIMGLDRIEDPEADQVMVSFAKQPLGYEEPAITEELSFKKKSFNIQTLIKDKSFKDLYKKVMIKRMDKNEALFYKMITNYFDSQEERVIADLEKETKGLVTKALIDQVLNEEQEIKLATTLSYPLLRRFLIEAGKESMDIYEATTGFDVTKNIEKWLAQRAGLFAKEITSTTYDKLTREFAQSFELGETRQQLIKRIEGVYAGFDENRAKTIARTETHGAMQKGNFEGSKQSGSDIRIWVSVSDENTRLEHLSADGQEVPIDKPFDVGGEKLMFPGDPAGSAGNTVNCRCLMI